ncbi:hypothetical protein BS78_01G234900 [Paspalum vaginatum]|nr:hypothetical protein BS78_01G234900 [Paspalum vaginatum]KAJ1295589.1 hypothetical protein BS78_01G234900 [Paspalum vaginatum]KAJ1295590.1 hypothetical protein BS78_01G234900 [Paspalum vaginatum]KAJ1295591.1 hypothetical protein BS78_01G234900 [Paspalum vaginatum]
MAEMYIPNMSRHKYFTTTLVTVKGKVLQAVDGTRFEEHTKREGRQQIEGDLAAKTWIYAAIAACLPDLGTTTYWPLPAASPIHPHHNRPSK